MLKSCRFLKNCFLQIKANFRWRRWRLPKIYECDPIELEFVGKNNVMPFKYSNISLSKTRKSFELESAWQSVCVRYDFIGEMIFCWNHYRYKFLKSVRVSKRIILKIYIWNENKDFGRVSCKYLNCQDLNFFVI